MLYIPTNFNEHRIKIKCCFMTEDDMSVPSFERSASALSRASAVGMEIQSMFDKEIVFIKGSPKIWSDFEDEDSVHEEMSTDETSYLEKRISCTERNFPAVRKCRGARNLLTGELYTRNFQNKNQRRSNNEPLSSRSSTYKCRSPRRASSSTSRVLDWIMTCFWRCSPGCQQLPTLK